MASADLFAAILYPIIPFIFLIIFAQISKLNFNGAIPWNWPILGMTPAIITHTHRAHDRITQIFLEAGSSFRFKGIWFSGLDFLLTVDPSNIHHILSSNFQQYPKGPDFKHIFEVFGDGFLTDDDSVSWQSKRRTAHALLRHHNFLRFLEGVALQKLNRGLIPILQTASENGSVLDLQDLFQRFSFDSTCMLVTGVDFSSLCLDFPDIPFSKAMDDVGEVIFLRHLFPKKLWELQVKFRIGQAKRLYRAWEIIDQTIASLLASKTQSLKMMEELEQEDQGVDLSTSYLKNYKDDKFLRDTILGFMIAGRDTLSSALSWFFFSLSNNPTVEARIREELKSTIPKNENQNQFRVFSNQEVGKLVYFHGALCEALRLYPPVPFQHKVSTNHDILPSGDPVNPKTKILISLYALGRMSHVWGKDCLEFKPERWISEKGTIKHVPSSKFLAFSAGPKSCLGKQVAFTQMKIVAAAIVHNYNVVKEIGHEVVPNASIILLMKHGFKVKVTKRWTSS